MNIGIARSNHFIQLAYVYSVSIVFTCYYALNSAILVKGSFVNGNSRVCKVDFTACTIDRLHASQIFTDRNCICATNFDTIAFGIGGICNNSCFVINSNGCSFLVCSLCNIYHRARFDSIILTIDFNACCSIFTTNSLYLRTGSKGFSFRICSIRNLNKSIVAASTATAGNGNSTINSLIAISHQADSCRILFISQSNFFNIVTIQRIIIFY